MCFENLICLTTQLVEFELRGKFVNGEVIWSKISTLKLYGSYERQLGRKTSPSAHVLYFHFLCYPLPPPPSRAACPCHVHGTRDNKGISEPKYEHFVSLVVFTIGVNNDFRNKQSVHTLSQIWLIL